MDGMLWPQSRGISAILELARMVTPPGHETMGFEDTDGTFYSLEQLKALEGQENQMDNLQKAIESLNTSLTPKRELTFCFRHGETVIAIGNDDTAWLLSPNKEWLPMQDMRLPQLPQGVMF